ncbi:helix-turn-helix transcriptional regulator [Lonepinella koalarum]|uniref:Helix-turn-helix protein n=1 Tax=Lonepinella koalarum TaxID=53417 RepID=A0A4R1KJY4_9PAST|nr:helix-turn-helix transcriptional regulator [Lonepinella koalarum]MDH2927320.1 hypothetical protein [Lonepinella koalarum]TCK64747.1 helix-turn-helix protein [Lonepinella koalarum]TFJ88793.1 XRE family transcriptional regulator [Lonepinella koalarum]TYG35554.1 helix-turn-helix transcriptional regulator [Lonepinella koalarum]
MSIVDRLKSVMENQGLSIKNLANQLDIPYRTLQNYLLNERTPSIDVLVKVSQQLNVDLNWLVLGQENENSPTNKDTLTKEELDLITHYRSMDKNIQNAFLMLFEKTSKN